MQKHLFILDKYTDLDFTKDTSLKLAAHLNYIANNCNIYFCNISNIFCNKSNSVPIVKCTRVQFSSINPISFNLGEVQSLQLDDFQVIHMRKDPPVDEAYITVTWMLDMVSDKVKILNHPKALRDFNEKFSIFRYPKYCRPTLVSSSVEELMRFFKTEAQGNAIIKPLFNYSGHGVKHIIQKDLTTSEIFNLFKTYTSQETQFVMIQPFESKVFEGEVRVFTIGTNPLVWCLKKPKTGQFLTNSSYGSSRLAYKPTSSELQIVNDISYDLQKFGVEIIGFDILAGFVSEINITSPRLLIPQDDKHDYYEDFARWVLQYC